MALANMRGCISVGLETYTARCGGRDRLDSMSINIWANVSGNEKGPGERERQYLYQKKSSWLKSEKPETIYI